MITKAKVEQISPDGYHVKVRIPTLHKIEGAPGATPFEELPYALVCYAPGCKPNLTVGDIVYVGFENNQISEPVILGMLLNNTFTNSSTTINADSLNVNINAQLPDNQTTVGNINVSNLANNISLSTLNGLNDRFESIEDTIFNLKNDGSSHAHATDHINIYVNSSTGNDLNDGLTINTAVETLDRGMEIMNYTTAGAYIYLLGEGNNYTLSYPVISSAMIHLMFNAPNITLYWLTPDMGSVYSRTKCFYNCYIHIDGYNDGLSYSNANHTISSKIVLGGNNDAYLESGKFTLLRTIIENDSRNNAHFGVYGGSMQATDCQFKVNVFAGLSNICFSNCTFTDIPTSNKATTADETSVLHIYNSSTVTFRDYIIFNNLNNNTKLTDLISANLATIYFGTSTDPASPIFDTQTSLRRITATTVTFNGSYGRTIKWLTNCSFANCVIRGENFVTFSGAYTAMTGTDNGWTYQKHGDGTYDAYKRITLTEVACNTTWGSMYVTAAQDFGTRPSFDKTGMQIFVTYTSSDGHSGWVTNWGGVSNTGTGSWVIIRPTSSTSLSGYLSAHIHSNWQ